MFWNKTNSARIDLLSAEITKIKSDVAQLNLDLEMYVAKLKQKYNLKKVSEETKPDDKPKDIYGGMFLSEDGKSHSSFGSPSSR